MSSVIYCANVTELTNTNVQQVPGVSTPPAVGALLAGYNQPGDGGGGEFYWASTAPLWGPDGGTVFATQGGGYWVRIFSGPISVRWFGAWGDGFSVSGAVPPGAHNDTVAIMNAFATASATGSAVYFPPGAYQVSPQTTTLSLGGSSSPVAVCASGDGGLYVADSATNKVLKIPRSYGAYKPVALSTVGAVNSLAAIAADGSGNVYVADNNSPAVYQFSLVSSVYTKTLVAGPFSAIAGVAVDSTGNIYVADSVTKAVYQVPFVGPTYGPAISIGTFASSTAVAVDSGAIYVLDSASKAIYWAPLPVKGVPTFQPISLPTTCVSPTSIAVDDNRNIYVLDVNPVSKAIYRVPSTQFGVSQPSEKISLPPQCLSPTGIAVDGSGSMYVSDAKNAVYQMDRGALLVDYKTTGSRLSAIAGAGISTTIIGTHVPAGHAVLELLGFDNVHAVNCELKNFQIAEDSTCSPQSYAMRMGDANSGFSAERMIFRGANGVLLRISSSASYAQLCTVFRSCTMQSNDGQLWGLESAIKDQPFYSLGSESHGAQWDNVLFESCFFEGLVSCVANTIEFDNCQFTSDASRGEVYGCGAEVLVSCATFHDCYFEDHYAAVRIQPVIAEIRRISIYDCFFSGNANLPGEKPVYGVWLQPVDLPLGQHRMIWEVNIARCVFTDDLYTKYGGASVAIDYDPDGKYVVDLQIDGAINLSSSTGIEVVSPAPITVLVKPKPVIQPPTVPPVFPPVPA